MSLRRLRADLVLLIVAALWGSAFVAQRAAGLLGSVYVFNAARFLLAALLLLPFAHRTRVSADFLRWTSIAGIMLFLGSALQQEGLRSTTAGNAGFLTSIYVVIVPLVLFAGWRERPRWSSVAAVSTAAVGAFLLSSGGGYGYRRGDLLEVAGAVAWAVHVVLLGKYAVRFGAIAFSVGQMGVCSVLNWVAVAAIEPPTFPLEPVLGASIAYTAIISLSLGYTLQIWAQRHAPPTDAAILLSLESVFSAFAGGAFLGERFSTLQLCGGAIIIGAVALSQAHAWSTIARGMKERGNA